MRWKENPFYNRELTRARDEPWTATAWTAWIALCAGLVLSAALFWSWPVVLVLALLSIPQFVWKYRRDRNTRRKGAAR